MLVRNLAILLLSKIKPFHNDEMLQRWILDLITDYKIKTFFETGTFRAGSLKWIAKRKPELDCISVESEREYYVFSKIRTAFMKNIKLIHGDSVLALNNYVTSIQSDKLTLYWLDAHWNIINPLKEELKVISCSKKPSIIIIDDIEDFDSTFIYQDFKKIIEPEKYVKKYITIMDAI